MVFIFLRSLRFYIVRRHAISQHTFEKRFWMQINNIQGVLFFIFCKTQRANRILCCAVLCYNFFFAMRDRSDRAFKLATYMRLLFLFCYI